MPSCRILLVLGWPVRCQLWCLFAEQHATRSATAASCPSMPAQRCNHEQRTLQRHVCCKQSWRRHASQAESLKHCVIARDRRGEHRTSMVLSAAPFSRTGWRAACCASGRNEASTSPCHSSMLACTLYVIYQADSRGIARRGRHTEHVRTEPRQAWVRADQSAASNTISG